jgi:4-hydroxy-3-methylbut-2-enyl diphosphate reductase
MEVLLANPRGFCAGVDRAIEIVERALELFGAPVYVRNEVVHNRFVVDRLIAMGAVFVKDLDEVPDHSTVIFSAHGVSRAVREQGQDRGLKVLDATCPLVTKIHREVARYCRKGKDVVLIGHAGHPEVEGTLGQWSRDSATGNEIYLVQSMSEVAHLQINQPDNLAYVTQTTLSVDETRDMIDALKERFPAISGPRREDICYATQNRQDAVKSMARDVDLILVVGSANSSNSNQLRETAEKEGVRSFLIDGADDIDPEWLQEVDHVGVTAGASAPEILVAGVIKHLQELGVLSVREMGGEAESMEFALPRELRIRTSA